MGALKCGDKLINNLWTISGTTGQEKGEQKKELINENS